MSLWGTLRVSGCGARRSGSHGAAKLRRNGRWAGRSGSAGRGGAAGAWLGRRETRAPEGAGRMPARRSARVPACRRVARVATRSSQESGHGSRVSASSCSRTVFLRSRRRHRRHGVRRGRAVLRRRTHGRRELRRTSTADTSPAVEQQLEHGRDFVVSRDGHVQPWIGDVEGASCWGDCRQTDAHDHHDACRHPRSRLNRWLSKRPRHGHPATSLEHSRCRKMMRPTNRFRTPINH